MLIIAALIHLSNSGVGRQTAVENGFYLRSPNAVATRIKSPEGNELRVGSRKTIRIQKGEMIAQDNANTRYNLSLTVPFDPEFGPSTHILVVNGTGYAQNGSGSSQNTASYLNFQIAGEDKAKEVSKFLNAPIQYRRHPHHMLRVRFSADKEQYMPGEEVIITLQVTNIGPETIAFMKGGRNRAERDNQYVFSARFNGKQVDDVGTSNHFGGLATKRVLRPNETFEEKTSLKKWFAFDKGGIYEILGSYSLGFLDPVNSSYHTVWEDYVTADFVVNVK